MRSRCECAERRNQAEQEAREDRRPERKRQHTAVDLDVPEKIWKVLGQDEDEQPDAPEGEHQTDGAGDERQQQVLRQELPEQPTAVGTGRGAKGQLLLPCHTGGEQQVGDVRASNQQHEAHSAQEKRQGVLRLTEEGVVEEHDPRPGRLGLLATRLEDLTADGGGFFLR